MDYATLTSAVVAAWEADGDTAFAAYLPFAIDQAEESLTRRLDSYGMVLWTSAPLTAGDPYVSVPGGIRVLKSVTHVSGGETRELLLRTDEYVRNVWPIVTSVGDPRYYAKRGYSKIYLCPTPANNATVDLSGVVRPPALTSASATNWFTDYASRALFNATMIEMARWSKNPSAVATWNESLADELAMMGVEDIRNRRDDQESANVRVNGGDNMLRGA